MNMLRRSAALLLMFLLLAIYGVMVMVLSVFKAGAVAVSWCGEFVEFGIHYFAFEAGAKIARPVKRRT